MPAVSTAVRHDLVQASWSAEHESMHCPPDLLPRHNDQWLAIGVHDATLYSGRQQHGTAVEHALSVSRGAFGQVAPALGALHS